MKEGVFKSGQNWTDSQNPCLQYFCDHGKVVVSHTRCPESVSCQDDQAPYFIPGICCMQCGKSGIFNEPHKFQAMQYTYIETGHGLNHGYNPVLPSVVQVAFNMQG